MSGYICPQRRTRQRGKIAVSEGMARKQTESKILNEAGESVNRVERDDNWR
jgi:hypothetical protein